MLLSSACVHRKVKTLSDWIAPPSWGRFISYPSSIHWSKYELLITLDTHDTPTCRPVRNRHESKPCFLLWTPEQIEQHRTAGIGGCSPPPSSWDVIARFSSILILVYFYSPIYLYWLAIISHHYNANKASPVNPPSDPNRFSFRMTLKFP
jgi:hypothetical protein